MIPEKNTKEKKQMNGTMFKRCHSLFALDERKFDFAYRYTMWNAIYAFIFMQLYKQVNRKTLVLPLKSDILLLHNMEGNMKTVECCSLLLLKIAILRNRKG